jgi:hypothetical protein
VRSRVNTEQDRDENAAKNIAQVGIGNCHDSKWTLRDCKTTTVAEPDEASRIAAALAGVSISTATSLSLPLSIASNVTIYYKIGVKTA